MELLQLQYFLDSARFGSFAKTAEKHMVPASSVSASVRRLEQELGQKLFDRSANRIILNENGLLLKKSTEQIFSELNQTVNDIKNPPDKRVIRLLVLCMHSQITDYILEYRKKHPGVVFDSCIHYEEDNFQNYDIIVSATHPQDEDYASFQLRRCRVFFQVSANHPLCGRQLTLRQLKDQPFVTMGGNLHEIIVNACNRAGFSPNIIAKVNDTSCYTKFMRSGIAIGHRRDFNDGPREGFAYLNVTDFNEHQTVCVFYNPAAAEGNVKNFLEFLKTKRH